MGVLLRVEAWFYKMTEATVIIIDYASILIMGAYERNRFTKHGFVEGMPMDDLLVEKSIKENFEAQVTAALMIQSNALIPIKLAVKLCGISRQEINRRISHGTFPKPHKLSNRKNAIRKAFYLNDLHAWIKNPHTYLQHDYH